MVADKVSGRKISFWRDENYGRTYSVSTVLSALLEVQFNGYAS